MKTSSQPLPPAGVCPVCGTPLPQHLPPDQCPKCLLQAGLPTERVSATPENGSQPTGTRNARHSWPRPGDQFGHYRIVRLLGQGGMGAVFEAEDLENGRRIALKVLSQTLDSPEARQRFLREGRLAASINHPNSVYVFGTEDIGGTPVIAMELVPGGTLQERVTRDGPLPVPQAIDAILQVIAGLEAARALGILHRDVKPSNCFEDLDGTIKIGDFGLSISTARLDLNVTAQGSLLGTPAFSSPEQLRSQELNVRSDLYAVGVTLFYLLTGRTPFEARDMVQLIANVLEQPAPSPKRFQPSLPQELAKAVLRCLEKQPGDRFEDYDQLRQALVPFSSAAPIPAPLGLRFAAGALDMFFVGMIGMVACLAIFGDLLPFPGAAPARNSRMLALVICAFTVVILYYSILEGFWGASVGKMLCRLRVAGPNRNPPGVAKAMIRAGLFQILPALPYWVSFGIDPMRFLSNSSGLLQYAVSSLYYLVVVLLFASARRRNGFAAIHDLLTGTRVIRKMAYQGRPVFQTPTEAPPATENQPAVGPYHVLGMLEFSAAGNWLLGYDTRLLRKVWLHVLPTGAPPVAATLRNLGRVGRLRWIAGRRSPEENWDAYEGVTGQPLLQLVSTPQPWTCVRFWLLDLATELDLAERTATLPDVLRLDRVWITAEGRAKLLDFPAPGLDNTSQVRATLHPMLATASTPQPAELNCLTKSSVELPATNGIPPVLIETRQRATQFLKQVACCAIEGPPLSSEGETCPISVPLPLHAREFLDKLLSLPGAAAAASTLQPLMQQVATVSRRRRLGLIAACAALPLIAGLASFFGSHMLHKWDRAQPDIWELNQLLFFRSSQRMPWNQSPGNFNDESIAVYIASHYRPTIIDSNQWLSFYSLAMVQGANRKFAEDSVANYPNPTEEQIHAAEDIVEPIIERFRAGNIMDQPWFPLLACGVSWIAYVALPALFAALLFRGGLVLRAFRLAVVRRDGRPASRWHVLLRSLVSWSPVLVAPLLLAYLQPTLGITQASVLLIALVAGVVLWSILLPERSLQDRLARTYLVPR